MESLQTIPQMAEKPEILTRIAVIAVHGVADQQASATARAAADMLLRAETVRPDLGEGEVHVDQGAEQVSTGHYQGFEQRELRIAVHAVLPKAEAVAEFSRLEKQGEHGSEMMRRVFGFQTQSRTIVAHLRPEAVKRELNVEIPGADEVATLEKDDVSRKNIDLGYMDEQLSQCTLSEAEAMYETIRLDSVRTGSRAHIHVFEMYWADLSRPVGSFIRWIIEFYQLLFLLCTVGRKSLDFARAEYELDARREKPFSAMLWPFFGWSQIIAEKLLAVVVPLLNLYLLGIGSAILPLFLPKEYLPQAVVAFMAMALGLMIGVGAYFWREFVAPGGRRWPVLIAPLLMIIGLAAVFLCFVIRPSNALAWATAVWWVVPLVAIGWLMLFYQKSLPGAFSLSLLVGAAVSGLYWYELWHWHSGPAEVMTALLRTAEVALATLALCWGLIMLFAFLATLAGFLVGRGVPDQGTRQAFILARDKARRAAWTTNLTLVLPALTVLIVNLEAIS